MGSRPSRGPHVGDSFMRAFRKQVHESSKTSVLGLNLLHLEQSRWGQTAIALAPPIKCARRYAGCAANFGNGDTRIGFVQKVQNLAVSMLGVSHRPHAFMCYRAKLYFWISGPFLRRGWVAVFLQLGVNPLRLHDRKDCLAPGRANSFHGHARTAAGSEGHSAICGARVWMSDRPL